MAAIHLALDAIDADFTLANGHGRIAGMALSIQGLRAQGFAASTYRGNRYNTIQESAAGWNINCQPGWYLTAGAVQEQKPLTATAAKLATLRSETILTLEQYQAWHDDLTRLAPGHTALAHQIGCDYLFIARRATYVIVKNRVSGQTYTLDQRIAWVKAMRQGALDITSASAFYAVFDQLTGVPDKDVLTVWAQPADATRLNLSSSVTITAADTPPVPASVELALYDWLADVTA